MNNNEIIKSKEALDKFFESEKRRIKLREEYKRVKREKETLESWLLEYPDDTYSDASPVRQALQVFDYYAEVCTAPEATPFPELYLHCANCACTEYMKIVQALGKDRPWIMEGFKTFAYLILDDGRISQEEWDVFYSEGLESIERMLNNAAERTEDKDGTLDV